MTSHVTGGVLGPSLWLPFTGTASAQYTFLKVRIRVKPRPRFWYLLCSPPPPQRRQHAMSCPVVWGRQAGVGLEAPSFPLALSGPVSSRRRQRRKGYSERPGRTLGTVSRRQVREACYSGRPGSEVGQQREGNTTGECRRLV